MRLQFYITATFLFIALNTNAQIINGGFEQWTNDTFGNELPTGWYSDGSAQYCLGKDMSSFSGNYAARIMSRAPGIEGPYYGYITTKLAAQSLSGNLVCKIAIDSVEHWTPDSSYATIRIDTSALFDGWSMTNPYAGLWRQATVTPGYITVNVPFSLPTGTDSFYVHLVARNVTQSLTNLNLGYVSFRVDDVTANFSTSVTELSSEQLTVYPNPTTGLLFIDNVEDRVSYEVFDLMGRVIVNGLSEGLLSEVATNSIDVSGLSDGNYLLRIRKRDGSVVSTLTSVAR